MLRLDGVDKTFQVKGARVPALRDVSATIPTGKLTSILGASGSGKTTLLRVIAGFEHPDSGRVSLDGRYLVGPGAFVRPEHRGIGIVPQDGALFPHLDVAGNVAFGLAKTTAERLSPARRRLRAVRVAELLALVGLEGYETRRVHQLSGGQQQRVALARALAPSPGVILLDEPFSAIDAALRAELGVEVRNLLAGLGITTILVTHDQEEALSLADQVIVMRDGRIVQAGTPREVYESPVDIDTARFVGDAVVLDGTVVSCDECEARVECVLGRLSGTARQAADSMTPQPAGLAAGGLCHVVIRPESLRMGATGTRAVVVSSEYYGHDAVTTLRLGAAGDGPTIRVRTFEAGPLPAAGTAVGIEVADPVLVVPAGH
jgi:iron(III) transport system ATP-binding protein